MLAPMESLVLAITKSPGRRRIAAAACLCALAFALPVAAYERSHYFAPMAKNDELTQGTVNAVLQDRSGLLWIGTQGGLHRYDGRELLAYQHQADVDGSLPESFVTALAETSDGTLYIGTSRSGLARMDRSRGRFVRLEADGEQAASRDIVTALAADAEGGLWVGAQSGLDRLDAAALDIDPGRRIHDQHLSQCELEADTEVAVTVLAFVIASKLQLDRAPGEPQWPVVQSV